MLRCQRLPGRRKAGWYLIDWCVGWLVIKLDDLFVCLPCFLSLYYDYCCCLVIVAIVQLLTDYVGTAVYVRSIASQDPTGGGIRRRKG